MMKGISILVVSSKLLLAQCIKDSLIKSAEFNPITFTSTFQEAQVIIHSQCTDVIILNDFCNTLVEQSFIKKVKELSIATKIIVLNSSCDYVIKALDTGIHSYITYDQSINEFIHNVKYCYLGYNIFPSNVNANTKFHLTAKEQEVLRLVSNGSTNLEIAKALLMSKRTVEYHISAILKKFNVKSRVEAVAEALKKNLIT